MPTSSSSDHETSKPTSSPAKRARSPLSSVSSNGHDAFVIPMVHISVPEAVVNVGFWGALVGAAALGAVELPLAALIGAGVLVARHHRST
jgi:hypothetical protein